MSNMTIIFNGTPIQKVESTMSYADVVGTYERETGKKVGNRILTVTYDRGPKNDREGSISQGGLLSLIDGMIVNAGFTDNA